jgi:hypothetical protein
MNRVPKELWKNLSDQWPNDQGPDPRMSFDFTVDSRDVHLDFKDQSIPPGEWTGQANTLEDAHGMYCKRIQRPQTLECDIQMKIQFGGHFRRMDGPMTPQFNTAYIYVARWRKDGAFMESYHVNQSKFAERGSEQNELDRSTVHPGLMLHWIQLAKERDAIRAEKKSKAE